MGKLSHATRRGAAAARLERLTRLAPDDVHALTAAEQLRRSVPANREIMAEGASVSDASIVLAGWACRARFFSDGRRQILSLVLPGELIGICRHDDRLPTTATSALTEVTLCPAPRPKPHQPGLVEAYARSGALEEFYLFRQIARLGRLSAYERMIDLMLEIRDRLGEVGLAAVDRFNMPMTQEALADLLGLTSVHVNRTLQSLRRDGLLELRGGVAYLKDIGQLEEMIDYRPAIISNS